MTEPVDKVIQDPASPSSTNPPEPVSAQTGSNGDRQEQPDRPGGRSGAERRLDVENLLETLRKERDEYLDLARRAQADLANYRKRVARQQAEYLEWAGEAVLVRLLPLIDALDAAGSQHPQTVQPLQRVLSSVLEAEGVERVSPVGEPFDPTVAEAVEHEGEGDTQIVSAVRRPGFRWKGRLLRPALVCVRSQAAEPTADGDTTGADGDTTGAAGDTTGADGDTTGAAGVKPSAEGGAEG